MIIDRVELMASLLGSQETLKFINRVKHQDKESGSAQEESKTKDQNVFYPFFAHVDASGVPKVSKVTGAGNNFMQRLARM